MAAVISKKPNAFDVAYACGDLTRPLPKHEHGSSSQHLVFSGPAGAILWISAVMRGCGDYPVLAKELQNATYSAFLAPQNSDDPNVKIVVFGCAETDRRSFLEKVFDTQIPSETSLTRPILLDHVVVGEERAYRDAFFEIKVKCSVSFHEPTSTVPQATRLRLLKLGDLSRDLVVETANPAQILVEAFLRLKHDHRDDDSLISAIHDPHLNTALLLFPLLNAFTTHRSRFPKITAGFPFSKERAAQDLAVVTTPQEYEAIGAWLRTTVVAMKEKEDQLKKHHGPREMQKLFADRAKAIAYFEGCFPYTDRPHSPISYTQDEDKIEFPFYPVTAHEPVRR